MHRRTFHISRTDSLPEELEDIADAGVVRVLYAHHVTREIELPLGGGAHHRIVTEGAD